MAGSRPSTGGARKGTAAQARPVGSGSQARSASKAAARVGLSAQLGGTRGVVAEGRAQAQPLRKAVAPLGGMHTYLAPPAAKSDVQDARLETAVPQALIDTKYQRQPEERVTQISQKSLTNYGRGVGFGSDGLKPQSGSKA